MSELKQCPRGFMLAIRRLYPWADTRTKANYVVATCGCYLAMPRHQAAMHYYAHL